MRVEVYYRQAGHDSRASRLLRSLQSEKASWRADTLDVYLVDEALNLEAKTAADIFADPIVQNAAIGGRGPDESTLAGDWNVLVEVSYKAGVTNPVALTAKEALENSLGVPLEPASVQTATLYLFRTETSLDPASLQALKRSLHNPLIQQAVSIERHQWEKGERLPAFYPSVHGEGSRPVQTLTLTTLNDDELILLSKNRLLALTLNEMQAIQREYRKDERRAQRLAAGLGPEPTDVELEMIAQTWSEHCKHKIFQGNVHYRDPVTGEDSRIASLYSTYIKQTTKDLTPRRSFLRSVFHDNSGVVQFDEETLVCFKVETHNSPSALDPFGGAITGIVGVNRDILGTGKGAKPIFNTNYLCFGDPKTPAEEIPAGLLHPKTVLEGVHRGIVEGGNHSGIPVVAGGFLFDESYKGKPLVFCGTGGILPSNVDGESAWIKHIDAGDLVVMLGGRIGLDGIHGATFSSLALDEASPTSAVQIGDPITQKKMLDFLLEARDLGLYKGITDNGAGGLSSSLGEMAESSGGVRIDLDLCLLKYQGLAPWEILVSESQERMSLAVAPAQAEAFLALAAKRGVEGSVVGNFTDSGFVEVYYKKILVGSLPMEFLHKGLPPLELNAVWTPPLRHEGQLSASLPLKETLLTILADPTVASKENLIRQYDHEVQGRSVVKPFCGEKMDGPSEGAVLKLKPWSNRGLTVTHGVCPRYGDSDPYQMAMNAVDEAYRAHVALGGELEFASVLDNFCWPDPVESSSTPDGAYKMAQLVKTCRGLRDACLAYGLPLISGKDSMKNDAVMDGKKVSIRPTLLISLLGVIADVSKAMTTDFLKPGDLVVLLGETRPELAGSTLEKVLETQLSGVPTVHPEAALSWYRALGTAIQRGLVQSVHDLSDGGLAVALAESCLGGRFGTHVLLDEIPGFPEHQLNDSEILFSESPSRFLLSVSPGNWAEVESLLGEAPQAVLGVVTEAPVLVVESRRQTLFSASVDEILQAWKGQNSW